MDLRSHLDRLHTLFGTATSKLAWLPPLLTRIVLFSIFATAGWSKLHSLDKFTAYFTKLGVPAASFQAPLVAGTELVCGSLLLVGLLSRLRGARLMSAVRPAPSYVRRRPELDPLHQVLSGHLSREPCF